MKEELTSPIAEITRLFGSCQSGQQILETYTGYRKFIDAWESPVGKEIMGFILADTKRIAAIIETGEATKENYIEYNFLKRYAGNIATKILNYNKFRVQAEKRLKSIENA